MKNNCSTVAIINFKVRGLHKETCRPDNPDEMTTHWWPWRPFQCHKNIYVGQITASLPLWYTQVINHRNEDLFILRIETYSIEKNNKWHGVNFIVKQCRLNNTTAYAAFIFIPNENPWYGISHVLLDMSPEGWYWPYFQGHRVIHSKTMLVWSIRNTNRVLIFIPHVHPSEIIGMSTSFSRSQGYV